MKYSIVVRGEVSRALRSVLADEIGSEAIDVGTGSLVVSLPDQSALVAAVSRLHELGLSVHQVRSHDDSPDQGLPAGDGAA